MRMRMTVAGGSFAMIPTLTRIAMLVMAAFTTSMLIGSSLLWASGQNSGQMSEQTKTVTMWVILAATYFVWAIVLDYVDHGSMARAMRGGTLMTAASGAVVVAVAVLWYGASLSGMFGA
jgi:hypothetical protein